MTVSPFCWEDLSNWFHLLSLSFGSPKVACTNIKKSFHLSLYRGLALALSELTVSIESDSMLTSNASAAHVSAKPPLNHIRAHRIHCWSSEASWGRRVLYKFACRMNDSTVDGSPLNSSGVRTLS